MASSVFVRLARSDRAYSRVEVHPDDAVTDFAGRAAAKCDWGIISSRVHLFLVERASTARDPTAEEENAALCKPFLPSTSLLSSVGIVHHSCLLARVDASDAGVRITLLVNAEDEFGELCARSVGVTISTQKELEAMIKHNGGGNLVLEDASMSVTNVSALVEGGVYSLIGGAQEAVKRHRTWTQTADKALEASATKAVRDATIEQLGKLETFNDLVIKNYAGKEQQLDGLLINSTVAIAVEAKHTAQLEHIQLVKDKVSFLQGVASEGSFPSLAGIPSDCILPVLASTYFSPEMTELCKRDGISTVKPNGWGHTFAPHANSRLVINPLRRSLHTLARAVRFLR